MKKTNLMLDIETMATSGNAAIIQIGACWFDPEDGTIHDGFCENIDLEEAVRHFGLDVCEKTKLWWKRQNQEIFNDIMNNGRLPLGVARDFLLFTGHDSWKNGGNVSVWSHATFDFPILNNFLVKTGNKKMPFRNARDIRTVVDLAGLDLGWYDWDNKTHNAYEDCVFQVKYLVDAMRMLRGKELLFAKAPEASAI